MSKVRRAHSASGICGSAAARSRCRLRGICGSAAARSRCRLRAQQAKNLALPVLSTASFTNRKIRIAVQNKGRLMEPSLAYLKECGLRFAANGRKLNVPCKNANMELLFVRSSDIPEYVRYGVADYGIVGRNVLMEKESSLKIVKELAFGKCSLIIAVPKSSKIKNLNDLDHERIATSYPRILKGFLKKQRISASIIEIRGSVEICPSLGLADAIFDITQTGRTLKENGLRVIGKVVDSQAVLIRNSNANLNYEDLFI